jgi:anti-sigma-K factor RskA
MNEQTISELLPAYVLGALSDEEKGQVEAWLSTADESSAARRELRDYHALLTGTAALVPPRRAPAHMREDFRKRLADAPLGRTFPVAALEGTVAHPPRLRRRVIYSLLAALLVVAFTILYLYTHTEAYEIAQIMHNPAAVTISLTAQGTVTGTVSVIMMPNSTCAVLVADLPPLSADQQYQLWLVKDQPVSGGVFSMTDSRMMMLVDAKQTIESYVWMGITIEPMSEDGSTQPTTSPIFRAKITHPN